MNAFAFFGSGDFDSQLYSIEKTPKYWQMQLSVLHKE